MSDVSRKVVAVVGESQVGKSALVNALLGGSLLPTAGVGRPRSQAICECLVDDLPVASDGTWRIEVDWLLTTEIVAALSRPRAEPVSAREQLFHEGTREGAARELATALATLGPLEGTDEIPFHLALGRDVSWLRLAVPCTEAQARRQLDPLTAGWAAALSAGVRLMSSTPHRTALIDLPGVGGYRDEGGEATRRWLEAHASSVSAVVCVIGPNGLGESLARVLLEHWSPADLRPRLHVVTTYADRLVEDRDCATQREAAAHARRARAVEQLSGLLRFRDVTGDLHSRVYCIDPRQPSRWNAAVDFDGERTPARLDPEPERADESDTC